MFYEFGFGVFTDFFRCSVLFDVPVFHNYDTGSECQCFPDIVCDKNDGHSQFAVNTGNFGLQHFSGDFVDGSEPVSYTHLFGLQSCGGSGGNADDPEPGPEPGAPKAKVSFALKSDINGVQDNDLKTALTHLRLYLYDKDQKLVSVNKYTSADALKAIELEKGNYTCLLYTSGTP